MNDTMLIDTNNAEKALGDAQAEFISAREAEDIADQALDDADTIDRITDTLESRIHGATSEEVEMAQIAVETICKRLGIASPRPVALENYKDRVTRPDATALAVEGLKEIGDTIWKYVLKIYRKIKEWLKKGYNYLFDGRQKLLKRAKSLEALVDKLEGDPKESVIKGSFIKALTFKDHFSDQNVISATKQIAVAAKSVGDAADESADVETGLKDTIDAIKKAVNAIEDKPETSPSAPGNRTLGRQSSNIPRPDIIKPLLKHLVNSVTNIRGGTSELASAKDSNKLALVDDDLPKINRMPGITGFTKERLGALDKLTGIANSSNDSGIAVLAEAEAVFKGLRADFIETSDKINEDFKAKVLDTSAMSQIVTNCIDGLEEAEHYDKGLKKLTEAIDKAERLISSAANSRATINNKELDKAIKMAMRINTKCSQLYSGVLASKYRHILDTARYSLDYVAQSAKQYKGGSMFGGGADDDEDEE